MISIFYHRVANGQTAEEIQIIVAEIDAEVTAINLNDDLDIATGTNETVYYLAVKGKEPVFKIEYADSSWVAEHTFYYMESNFYYRENKLILVNKAVYYVSDTSNPIVSNINIYYKEKRFIYFNSSKPNYINYNTEQLYKFGMKRLRKFIRE